MVKVNPKMLHVPKHKRDRMISAPFSESLREQYGFKSAMVVKGDSVKIMRGEYKGVEGKVEEIITTRASLLIEGVQREKIRGGNVRLPIHSSKVMITAVNLDDSRRSASLRGTSKPAKGSDQASPAASKKEQKTKEVSS